MIDLLACSCSTAGAYFSHFVIFAFYAYLHRLHSILLSKTAREQVYGIIVSKENLSLFVHFELHSKGPTGSPITTIPEAAVQSLSPLFPSGYSSSLSFDAQDIFPPVQESAD